MRKGVGSCTSPIKYQTTLTIARSAVGMDGYLRRHEVRRPLYTFTAPHTRATHAARVTEHSPNSRPEIDNVLAELSE
jgi:hypothetical protein